MQIPILRFVAIITTSTVLQFMQLSKMSYGSNFDSSSFVNLQQGTSASGFDFILQTGLANRIPLGIALSENDELCTKRFTSTSSKLTVSELIDRFNQQFAAYKLQLTQGVLEVEPRPMPSDESDLLNLILPTFHARSGYMAQQETALWMHIRAQIAPTEATAFLGARSLGAEVLPAIEGTQVTVRQVLNQIVSQGKGGVWLVHDKKFDSHMPDPVDVYGYLGEDVALRASLKCSEPPTKQRSPE